MQKYVLKAKKCDEIFQSALIYLLLTIALANGQQQQRVVPGVNPQHYQHGQQAPQQQYQPPPQPPHYQQQQQQQQQHPPQQQQQVYQQQQQQQQYPPGQNPQQYQNTQQYQAPQQQVPVQPQQQHPQQVPVQQFQQAPPAQHVPHAPHGHHDQQQQVLNAGNIQQERAHIQEHMQVPIDTSKMTEAELQFHYFKMHDSDNNNKLDGCELIKSLIHWHDPNKKSDDAHADEAHAEEDPHKDVPVYTDETLIQTIDYVLKEMDDDNDGYINYAEYKKKNLGPTP